MNKSQHPGKPEKKIPQGIDPVRSQELARRIKMFHRRNMFSVFVFTAAQNATPVHKGFFKALQSYLKHRHAEDHLYVLPFRYKNPTAWWSKRAEHDDWWVDEVRPHLMNKRVIVNQNLMVMGDIPIQPTAESPLSGNEAISGDKSAIFGHTKIQMRTVATPQNKMPKILITTGAITVDNYIPSKAGKKGEFHHTIGATVVEIVANKFFLRQIYAKPDGSFMDLDYEYLPDAPPRKIDRIEALVLGDGHLEAMADNVIKATYGAGGIVEVLRPKCIVHHDFIDFKRRSHHTRKDPIEEHAIWKAGHDSIETLLDEAAKFIDDHTPKDTINAFPWANHTGEHMKRWHNECDPKKDPPNSIFWSKTNIVLREQATLKKRGVEQPDIFAYWMLQKLKTRDRAIFLKPGDPFIRAGVDMGFHGDKGSNGSRGSLKSYSKIGIRTIIGHSHAPGIEGGAMQVGMSCEYNMVYEQGAPNNRLQCHGIVYSNGKRTLLIIVDDGWRAEGYKRKRKHTHTK